MSGRTRRWRGAVLAIATAVAFAGGLLVLDSGIQPYDYGWGAPVFDAGTTLVR